MINTYCKGCVFNNVEGKECWFDIPDIVRETKDIIKKDDFNLIRNYRCMFGSNLESHKDKVSSIQELANFVTEKNLLKYYLFVDCTTFTKADIENKFDNLIDDISNITNPPRFVSFLLYFDEANKKLAENIEQNINPDIKWKLHNINQSISVDQAKYVNIATNIGKNNSNCILYFEPAVCKTKFIEELENVTKFVHFSQMVLQENTHLFMENKDTYHKLFLPNIIYKEIIGYGNKNILETIQKISSKDTDFKIKFYETT